MWILQEFGGGRKLIPFAVSVAFHSPIPAEAHWQVDIVENAITVKHVMTSLAEEFKDMSMQELFSRSLWACNPRDNQCGLCSMQSAEHQMSGVACLKVSFIITQFTQNGWLMEVFLKIPKRCPLQSRVLPSIRQMPDCYEPPSSTWRMCERRLKLEWTVCWAGSCACC